MFIENKLWQNSYETIIGKSHIKVEMPNQDAVLSKCLADDIMVSAVADGHGSKKCTRSHIGAEFAVESAVEIFEEIQDHLLKDDTLNTKVIGRKYTKKVVKHWKHKVHEHLKENPLNVDEMQGVTEREKKNIKKNQSIAYGSTLLIILLIKDYIVIYQLGDGDILFVSQSKKVSKPIKRDERHIANDTSSLCFNRSEREFKIKVFRDIKHILKMIILSTDGYSNSFSSEKGFLKVGTDLVELITEEGFEVIDENLRNWIEETSNHGSGDDTSVSIITRIEETV
jgi:serine/threonine protein phosphatase PrpC